VKEVYYSPLRYPGGKGKLAPFMKLLIEKTEHMNGVYIEPFAGGAGIAFDCLLNEVVSEIVINDLDKGIYSFWRAILEETDRFINDVMNVPLNINEWEKQRQIYLMNNQKYSYELGFSTFYLNRTNRSGIIKGGVIGGKKQTGKWTLGARFNRGALAARIHDVALRKNRIYIYNKDISSFLSHYVPKYAGNAMIYFDPPYYEKGKELYLNFFTHNDHVRIRSEIEQLRGVDWIITYDDCPEILNLYSGHVYRRMHWNYSAATKRTVNEIMIFQNAEMIPTKQELKKGMVKTLLFDMNELEV
jgi:DNA adenine methylase